MTIVDTSPAVGSETVADGLADVTGQTKTSMTEEELREFKRMLLKMQRSILLNGFDPGESKGLHKQLENEGMLKASLEMYDFGDDICAEDVAFDDLEVE